VISTSEINAGRAASARQSRRVGWRRAPKALSTALIDIDVALTDIVFQRHRDGVDSHGPKAVVDYAIEGIVPGGAADEGSSESEPFLVYVSGYEDADRMDRGEDFDQRSVCYIETDRRPDHAWRTNIYIERFIFRRLVELYASRRIDSAKISLLLKVLRSPSGAVEVPSLSHPMLRSAGGRHGRHSRAHLMSVQTSLSAASRVKPAILSDASAWGARMGRRQVTLSDR
jgi:hypothetical protein